jgi:hypothetical protein
MSNTKLASEKDRIAFLIHRDGVDGALGFADRTMRIYRKSVLDKGNINRAPHHATFPSYRRSFIESYLELKRFKACNQQT